MEKTPKYMTVEECKLYRQLAAKYEAHSPEILASLPCCPSYPKVNGAIERKPRKKRVTAKG